MMTEEETPRTVRITDVDLAYVTEGQGDPVVFVHGSVNDYRSWLNQLAPFRAHYRVITYSRRYHWPNVPPAPGTVYAIHQHVSDLGALIEALGPSPVHLIGSSYGAMTALTLAVERPGLIRSLVLGEPPLLPWLAEQPEGEPVLKAFLSTAFEPARDAFARGEPATGVRTFINGVVGPGAFDRLPPAAQEMMRANAAAMSAETTSPSERYFPPFGPDQVARLPMPVLLVEGAVSPPMFGLITDRLARALPTAGRVTIPAASHGMHNQNPAAYTEAVLGFLDTQGPTT